MRDIIGKMIAVVFVVVVISAFAYLFYFFGKEAGWRQGVGYPAVTALLETGQMYGVIANFSVGKDRLVWLESVESPRQRVFEISQSLTEGAWYRWTGTNFTVALPGQK